MFRLDPSTLIVYAHHAHENKDDAFVKFYIVFYLKSVIYDKKIMQGNDEKTY